MKRLADRCGAKTRERNYEQIYSEWLAENKHRAAANPLLLLSLSLSSPVSSECQPER